MEIIINGNEDVENITINCWPDECAGQCSFCGSLDCPGMCIVVTCTIVRPN